MSLSWNQLRITQRFIVVLCAFVLSVVAVAATGLWGLSSARDSLKSLHDEAMARSLLASQSIESTPRTRLTDRQSAAFSAAPAGRAHSTAATRTAPKKEEKRSMGSRP